MDLTQKQGALHKSTANSNSQTVQNDADDSSSASVAKDLSGVTPKGTFIQIEEISEGIFKATTEKSKYIIEYDINKCIGAASCAAIAPLTFFMNEENKAEMITDGEWDEDDIILSAAQSCPVFAIKIFIKDTNEMIFPTEDIY